MLCPIRPSFQVEGRSDWTLLSSAERTGDPAKAPIDLIMEAGLTPSQNETAMDVDDQQRDSLGHAVLIEGRPVRPPVVPGDAYDVPADHPGPSPTFHAGSTR